MVDANPAALHGPSVLEVVLPLSKLLHYVGFSMALGSASAATLLRRASVRATGERRASLEVAVAELVAGIEVPGVAVVLFAGVLAVFANPAVLDPEGGLGSWMFVKLPLVMGLAAIAFTKMFGARLLVRERTNGATEAECSAHTTRGARLDAVGLVLGGAILAISALRYVLFG